MIFGAVSVLSDDFSITAFAGKFVTFRTCGIYYYFAVYIQLTLLTPLIARLVRSDYWKAGFLITPITYIPMYGLVIMKMPLKFPKNAICCLVWCSFFYIGLCIRNGRISLKAKSTMKWIIIFILVSIAQAIEGSAWFRFGDFDMATTQFKYTALIGTSISIVLLLLYIMYGKKMFQGVSIPLLCDTRVTQVLLRWLKRIGDYSFGIYLSHMLIMTILSKTLYAHIPKIFIVDVLFLLIIEIIGIGICKRLFGRWPRFCRWVGLN
jgi:peptidoglycan/LPS O-acetylase OafA/YrhL